MYVCIYIYAYNTIYIEREREKEILHVGGAQRAEVDAQRLGGARIYKYHYYIYSITYIYIYYIIEGNGIYWVLRAR